MFDLARVELILSSKLILLILLEVKKIGPFYFKIDFKDSPFFRERLKFIVQLTVT